MDPLHALGRAVNVTDDNTDLRVFARPIHCANRLNPFGRLRLGVIFVDPECHNVVVQDQGNAGLQSGPRSEQSCIRLRDPPLRRWCQNLGCCRLWASDLPGRRFSKRGDSPSNRSHPKPLQPLLFPRGKIHSFRPRPTHADLRRPDRRFRGMVPSLSEVFLQGSCRRRYPQAGPKRLRA